MDDSLLHMYIAHDAICIAHGVTKGLALFIAAVTHAANYARAARRLS